MSRHKLLPLLTILRSRLGDVWVPARWLVGYLVTAVVLSPVPLAVLLLLRLRGAEGDDHARRAAELVVRDGPVLCLAFLLALPLLGRVGRVLDRLMRRRQHGVRDALVALGDELRQLVDRDRLAHRLTHTLVTRIPAAHASLHVVDEAGADLEVLAHVAAEATPGAAAPRIGTDLAARLARSGQPLFVEATVAIAARQQVSLLLPLIREGRLAAVLCVGEKRSGEIYARWEIELLQALLREAGLALHNARLHADLRRQLDALRRTQDQLRQSAKLDAIGELAAGLAHQVNNPLMVITGHAGLLRRRAELAAIHPTVDIIEAQATRAAGMIRGLLDFTRRRPRHLEPVRLREVIERALALVADRLDGRAIETVLLLDAADPAVLGDREELTQVFVNLVGNAADAMPGGGRLSVGIEVRRQDEVAYVSARVGDTGPGIPLEHREQIFESFFTTKPEGQGIGLGLAVTLDIVKNHEGTIEVESAPGKGTTMIVNLPLGA